MRDGDNVAELVDQLTRADRLIRGKKSLLQHYLLLVVLECHVVNVKRVLFVVHLQVTAMLANWFEVYVKINIKTASAEYYCFGRYSLLNSESIILVQFKL